MRRVGGAKKSSRGQDCPPLDSRLRGNDIVGVASTAPHPELVEGRGFKDRACYPIWIATALRAAR